MVTAGDDNLFTLNDDWRVTLHAHPTASYLTRGAGYQGPVNNRLTVSLCTIAGGPGHTRSSMAGASSVELFRRHAIWFGHPAGRVFELGDFSDRVEFRIGQNIRRRLDIGKR